MATVLNVTEILKRSDGSEVRISGDSKFYAQSNYANLLLIDVEDGGSLQANALINFTPQTRQSFTSHDFFVKPVGIVTRVVNEEIITAYQYAIQIPKLVLQNNTKEVIESKLTFKIASGTNYRGYYATLSALNTALPPTEELETNKAVAYVVQTEEFYQVLYNSTSVAYEWTVVQYLDMLLVTKQYSLSSIYIQGGFSSPQGIAPISSSNTQVIMSILNDLEILYQSLNISFNNHVRDLNNPHGVKAIQVPFNKTGTNLTSDYVEGAIKEVNTKSDANAQNITDMKDGTTIVKKAEQDKNGNDIVNTYETKTIVSGINNRVTSLETQATTIYDFKGSVAFESLPTTGQKVGDTYNITNNFTLGGQDYLAGTNVAWNGTDWDALASRLPNASEIDYDNTSSEMTATTVQGAIDELEAKEQPILNALASKEIVANKKSVINDSEMEFPNSNAVSKLLNVSTTQLFNGLSFNAWFTNNQKVSNWNFITLASWNELFSIKTLLNNVVTVVGDGTDPQIILYNETILDDIGLNEKYYVFGFMRTLDSEDVILDVYVNGDTPTARITNPIQNEWYFNSGVGEHNNVNQWFVLRALYSSSLIANGKTFEAKNVGFIRINDLITLKQYSPIFKTTFDLMTYEQIKIQLDEFIKTYVKLKENSIDYILKELSNKALKKVTPTLSFATSSYLKYSKNNFGEVSIEGNISIDGEPLPTTTEYNTKKIIWLGDSITDGYGASSEVKKFRNIVADELNFASSVNYASGGASISKYNAPTNNMIDIASTMTLDTDIVMVMGGINDAFQLTPIGSPTDTDPTLTFYGGLNTLMTYLQTNYAGKRIIFMSPFKADTMNPNGFATAMQNRCRAYNFEFINIYEYVGFDLGNPFDKATYAIDIVHLNDKGNRRIADIIISYLNKESTPNLYVQDLSAEGYSLGANGEIAPAAGFAVSDYIGVEPYKTYYYKFFDYAGTARTIAFYDENHVFISDSANIDNFVRTPLRAKYVKYMTYYQGLSDRIFREVLNYDYQTNIPLFNLPLGYRPFTKISCDDIYVDTNGDVVGETTGQKNINCRFNANQDYEVGE